MIVLYVPLVFIGIAYLVYFYLTRTFNYWKKRGVISPEPVPFFGNIKETALRRKTLGTFYRELYSEFPNEKVVGIYRMTTPCLLIRDLDIIKHIMIKDFNAFSDRGIEFSKTGLGANLFHADGDTWQVLRNRFTPIFTSGKLKNMFYLLNERGDKFIEYLDGISYKQPEQEVHKLLQKYTLSSISACAFGLNIEWFKDNIEELNRINSEIFTLSFRLELDMMYPGVLKILNASVFPKHVTNFFNNLVKLVIRERNGKPTKRHDFMDLILELRETGKIQGSKKENHESSLTLELTEDVIAAQAFVFFAAGYETSASTMAFMMYELAKNPDVQDKLIAEIDDVLQKSNGEVTYECLKEITYMRKVFDETLRMYPILDPLQRNAKIDYTLPGTNVTVKKGQTVLITPMGIHYDEKLYPNPEKFDPERFNLENSKERHPCAYIPFGLGPRNCIGMRFAKVQSQVCVTKLLSKYRVEPSRNTKNTMKLDPKISIVNPLEGIYLNLVPRL